jgi:hypothetical protein
MTMSSCHCLVRHALTDVERAQVAQALRYARAIGDPLGIMLALAQLTGTCPAKGTT